MSNLPRLGDRYELRGILGIGGMAEVHDGWDTRLNRPVAIKLLNQRFSGDADSRLRFHAEARSAAGLSHPNIVAVHDYGEHDGVAYIVMERLGGQTLADRIAQSPLPPSQTRAVIDDVLSALTIAHGAGILHRDIKPANILFTAQGGIKVADFGLAKTNETGHTQAGQIVGTLAYLSPSRLMGQAATVADDLYAVGCTGYEALTGRRAFPEDAPGALTRSIMDDTPPPLRSIRPDVDVVLADVIERAMARDPRRRFGSAEAMRAALANPVVPQANVPRRPPTMVLTAPFASPSPSAYVGSSVGDTPRRGVAKWIAVAGIMAVFALAAILLLSNSVLRDNSPGPTMTPTSTTAPALTTTSTTTTTTTTAPEVPPENGNGQGERKKKDKGRH